MTDWRILASNSETLSAADLQGQCVTATIESVTGALFEDEEDKSKKPSKAALIAFKNHTKKFAAKPLNCQLIEAMWGKEVEDWIGHRLTIGPDVVEVAGHLKGQPCIRVMGSPELDKPVTVQIALPRRRPFPRQLKPTPTGREALPFAGPGD